MDLEDKVIGFQFEQERSVSNHEEFFQDSSDEGDDAMEWDLFDRKESDPSVWCKCRNAPQWKQKGNACAVEKWRRFLILILRVYLSWVKQ